MAEIRLRAAVRADDAFFREMELHTTWHSLNEGDRERLKKSELRDALEVTHELLLERPGNQIIIAENERGERMGLLWFGMNRNLVTGEEEAWIYNISVVAEFQGQGVGRRLMEHAEELARRGGFWTLGLMVAAHNSRARALYERLEYAPTNVVMRKRLREP